MGQIEGPKSTNSLQIQGTKSVQIRDFLLVFSGNRVDSRDRRSLSYN